MLRISFNKVHRYTALVTAMCACTVVVVTLATFVFNREHQQAHAQSLPTVQPTSPIDNSYHTGLVTLSSKVDGTSPDTYEMFWAVGNGEWNKMTTNASTGVSTTVIDSSTWNWQQDNRYVIRYIALLKDGWRPIESSLVINKGSPPLQTSAAASPPQTTSTFELTPATPKLAQDVLYVDSEGTVAEQLSRNPQSQSLQYMAKQSTAHWYGGWNADVNNDVDSYISRAAAAKATPTIVIYNIPGRDCGSYSAGGAATYGKYIDWVRQIADGINGRKAIIIVEPDALAGMDCLNNSSRHQRMNAISQVVSIVKTAQSRVYIDAGHSDWQSTATMATRLKSAGIAKADGFSLNVSNFRTTDESVAYGNSLSAKVGDKHFVVDTSRNGNGASTDNQWCNPAGRGLGEAPTMTTGKSLVDAYLWIKTPGDSDGACGSGAPSAGQWWQSYAEMLYLNRKNDSTTQP